MTFLLISILTWKAFSLSQDFKLLEVKAMKDDKISLHVCSAQVDSLLDCSFSGF